MKTFTQWVENLEVRKEGVKDAILAFLKTQLHINDDDVILNMNTSEIDPTVVGKLTNLGEIANSSPDILNSIKNGITIQDLIDSLASSEYPEQPTI